MDLSAINGVRDLATSAPIGASLQISIRKGFTPNGIPDQKDRFHLLTPREVDGVKLPHPAFAAFNNASPEHRQVIRGVIVHAHERDCFDHSLAMQTYPKTHSGERSHPQRKPVCKGDGVRAMRWLDNKYVEIPCPGPLCEYSQSTPAACRIRSRFVFSIRWAKGSRFEHLSTPLVKFVTQGWASTSAIKGFLDFVAGSAVSLGVPDYSLFGLPFVMTLTTRTNKAKKSRYQVVTLTTDLDVFEFLLQQQQRREQLGVPIKALSNDAEISEDFKSIEGPTIDENSQTER